MCGISGQVKPRNEVIDRTLVQRMTRALAHRGPDDEGFRFEQNCGLGHRRLSIIDLSTGAQPLSNEDKTIWLVSNNEIYNYLELRKELISRGHRFSTSGDTEVILHLYEDLDEKCVEPLVGMFAFAIWDSRRKRLLLARDRFGIKPLYYHEDNDGGLLFASELKALLLHAGLSREMDLPALHQYFLHLTIPEPSTILEHVHKLPAAHLLIWEDGKAVLRPYWDLAILDRPAREIAEEDALEDLRYHLQQTVALSLRSDVPVGLFLSGGLDSSILTWMASAAQPTPVKTFSVAFTEKQFDEGEYSRLVARRFGTHHQEILVTKDAATNVALQLSECLDEPFADSSCIPTYLLCKHARESVKTVLTGEGSDELFAGSPWHRDDQLRSENIDSLLYPPSKIVFTRDQLDSILTQDLRSLISKSAYDPASGIRANLLRCVGGLEQCLYTDLKVYLPSDLLTKVDRMSMLASLEARVPYLNHPFAEFAWTLPPNLKLRNGIRKHLLRRLSEDMLPMDILNRPKKGFSIPMDLWLWEHGTFRDMVYDTLLDRRTKMRGQFNPSSVQSMLEDHDKLRQFHGYRLWTLFVFEMWQRNFADSWCTKET